MKRREGQHRGPYGRRGLGLKAWQAYWFIADYIKEHHYAPSFLEISQHLGIAKSGAARYVQLLIEEGYLARDGTGRRTTRVTDKMSEGNGEHGR